MLLLLHQWHTKKKQINKTIKNKALYMQTCKGPSNDYSFTEICVSRIKHKLKELGKSFVFVPADKAANNVI